jgi:hypothetical protein
MATPALLRKIGRVIDIGDEPGLFRLPAEQRPCPLARGRDVEAREHNEPAEMLGRRVDAARAGGGYNPATPADAERIRSLTGSARALERT